MIQFWTFFPGPTQLERSLRKKDAIWIACDLDQEYVAASVFRFFDEPFGDAQYEAYLILKKSDQLPLDVSRLIHQPALF